MSRLLLCVLFTLCLCVFVSGSRTVPAQSLSASPVSAPVIGPDGAVSSAIANPIAGAEPTVEVVPPPTLSYLPGTDYMGRFYGVPVNPTVHLQKSLEDDKKYIASILRTPIDFGDPADCKHSDIVKDEQELRKIALRVNHRRIALKQQQHWIDAATEGLKKIETEIQTTTETAKNLAEQLDALAAQRDDISNHVRRAVLIKELDNTSSNLMRLKDARLKEEVNAQQKHNTFAIRNHKHNNMLKKLHKMRTRYGLALGKLHDPKPYRFQQLQQQQQQQDQDEATGQQEVDHAALDATEAENEEDSEQQQETENDNDNENENEAEAEAETEGEGEAEESE